MLYFYSTKNIAFQHHFHPNSAISPFTTLGIYPIILYCFDKFIQYVGSKFKIKIFQINLTTFKIKKINFLIYSWTCIPLINFLRIAFYVNVYHFRPKYTEIFKYHGDHVITHPWKLIWCKFRIIWNQKSFLLIKPLNFHQKRVRI